MNPLQIMTEDYNATLYSAGDVADACTGTVLSSLSTPNKADIEKILPVANKIVNRHGDDLLYAQTQKTREYWQMRKAESFVNAYVMIKIQDGGEYRVKDILARTVVLGGDADSFISNLRGKSWGSSYADFFTQENNKKEITQILEGAKPVMKAFNKTLDDQMDEICTLVDEKISYLNDRCQICTMFISWAEKIIPPADEHSCRCNGKCNPCKCKNGCNHNHS